jgi:hypothetical protein
MNVWLCQQVSVLRECVNNAPYNQQLCLISALLFTLSLPIYLFVPTSLMGKIFVGIFFGTYIADHMWRNRYPALKRWITEREYRYQVVALYERFCNASRPDKIYSVGVPVLMLIGITAAVSRSLLLLKIGLSIGYGVCILGFIDEVLHEWYPALKQKPGMGYIFLAMNFILGVAAYALAYEYINFLTGVAPNNFVNALTVFSMVAIVPVWMMTIGMMAAVMVMGSMVGLPVIDILLR